MNEEDAPPLRVERIIAALEENRVKYVLVGGIAGRFHGAQRATSDLDICPAWDRDNLERLTAAARSPEPAGDPRKRDQHSIPAARASKSRYLFAFARVESCVRADAGVR